MSIPATQLTSLANQLQAFIITRHPFTDEFEATTLRLLEQHTAPSIIPSSLDLRRSSHSNDQQPSSLSPYPVEWAETRTHLPTAIRHFQALANYWFPNSATTTTPASHCGCNYQPTPPTMALSESTSVSEAHDAHEPASATMSAPE